MQEAPRYNDVVAEVAAFLEDRLAHAVDAGIEGGPDLPRPGFRVRQDARPQLGAASRLDRIVAIGRPVMVGISRKSTLARIVSSRDPHVGSDAVLGAAVSAFDRGATLFRVHDVRSHVEALAVAAAVERGTVER